MNLMFQPLRKYADFDGRAGRMEYWLYFIFTMAVALVLSAIGSDVIAALVWLALLVPSVALGVRRLHDVDMSGLWYLFAFLPVVGAIFLLILGLIRGTRGENRFS